MPFQAVGGPDSALGPYVFTPTTQSKTPPLLAGKRCFGLDLREATLVYGLDLNPLLTLYERSSNKSAFFIPFFSKIAGTALLQKQVEQGLPQAEIRASWEPSLSAFKAMRSTYLLYQPERAN
jgi:hypothetical protein